MEKPEVPLEQTQEDIAHRVGHATEPWIMGVALTAAILAVLAALSSLLAEHHANEAMIRQIQSSDQWAYYQAKGIKAGVVTTRIELMAAQGKPPAAKDQKKLAQYEDDQERIKEDASELQRESESHLRTHTPLAFGVTMFQVGIAVGAISVLTKRKVFWYVAIGFGLAGAVSLMLGLWMPPWFTHLLSGASANLEIGP
jgi:hypothetical protein